MILFFDGVSSSGYIWLFDSKKQEIAHDSFTITGNESTQTIPIIETFLQAQSVPYTDIQHIVAIVWPWSFTGVRTITLVLNTIAYIYPHISLTGLSFFELFDTYPIFKQSSKRDVFAKYKKWDIITIVPNTFLDETYRDRPIFWDIDTSLYTHISTIHNKIDYTKILQNIVLSDAKRLSPLYIKKPNIS